MRQTPFLMGDERFTENELKFLAAIRRWYAKKSKEKLLEIIMADHEDSVEENGID